MKSTESCVLTLSLPTYLKPLIFIYHFYTHTHTHTHTQTEQLTLPLPELGTTVPVGFTEEDDRCEDGELLDEEGIIEFILGGTTGIDGVEDDMFIDIVLVGFTGTLELPAGGGTGTEFELGAML